MRKSTFQAFLRGGLCVRLWPGAPAAGTGPASDPRAPQLRSKPREREGRKKKRKNKENTETPPKLPVPSAGGAEVALDAVPWGDPGLRFSGRRAEGTARPGPHPHPYGGPRPCPHRRSVPVPIAVPVPSPTPLPFPSLLPSPSRPVPSHRRPPPSGPRGGPAFPTMLCGTLTSGSKMA